MGSGSREVVTAKWEELANGGGGNKEVGRRITWEVGPGKSEEGLHGKWEQGSGLNENPRCVFVLTRGPGTKSRGARSDQWEQGSGKKDYMGSGKGEVGRRLTWEVGRGKYEEGLHGK